MLYAAFLVNMAITVALWETHILGSTISAFIGLIILIILHSVYELPQRMELGRRDYYTADNINDMVHLIN